MAINVSRGLLGQSLRVTGAETPAPVRAAKVAAAEPVAQTELKTGTEEVKGAGTQPAFETKISLNRPVEQTERTDQPRLSATNRTLSFDTDETTGRSTITVTEEVNGEKVERQIPATDYLAVLDRLTKVKNDTLPQATGRLVDIDG